jgi:hypothetical protein
MATVDLSVYVETTTGDPLQGVYVALHQAPSTSLVLAQVTDVDGLAVFPNVTTDGDTEYYLRVRPVVPVSVVGSAQKTIVASTTLENTFVVTTTIPSLPVASNPNKCRLSGYFTTADGSPAAGLLLQIGGERGVNLSIVGDSAYAATAVVNKEKEYEANAAGYFDLELFRGAEHSVILEGYSRTPRMIQVPDAAAASLVDVLFPYAHLVKFLKNGVYLSPTAAPALTLVVGEVVELLCEPWSRGPNLLLPSEISFTSTALSSELEWGYNVDTGVLKITALATGEFTMAPQRQRNTDNFLGLHVRGGTDMKGVLTITV